ncbi:MAG TPA: MogA/MoaB family molybdenum cofactor biosynthesis protein [Candidatus Polarisedimenticolia bacterium]|nr:MogA/MoaB family molybdenum cofactor biosynthesis protein [Candidatus Polarisedimenticolia bacterium]
MPHHDSLHGEPRRVSTAILTVSDTRTLETDASGALIRRLLLRAGHPVVDFAIVPDDPKRIRRRLNLWSADRRIQAVILTGGTGVSPRDQTFEAVEGLLEKKLDGFGEIFRMLSYRQVGSAAILSRALAGIYRNRIVFSLPGSERAVSLAMRRIILPELGHLAHEVTRGAPRRGGGGPPAPQLRHRRRGSTP